MAPRPQVIWGDDTRYPGPEAFELPDFITGVPTQAELDAQPRLFTWGDLKDFIKTGELEHLSRNKQLQHTYEKWMAGQKDKWGSTENYLINARLPWGKAHRTNKYGRDIEPEPTYDQHTALSHPEIDLTPSTRPRARKEDSNTPAKHRRVVSGELGAGSAMVAAHALGLPPSPTTAFHSHNGGGLGLTPPDVMSSMSSAVATAGCSRVATAPNSQPGSGASTPSSVAYVSLDSVLPKINRRLERSRRRAERARANSNASSLKSGESARSVEGQTPEDDDDEDDDDEPDIFLKFDPASGLDKDKYALLPNDWPYCVPYGVRHYCLWSRVPIAHPVLVNYDRTCWEKIESEGLGGFTGVIPAFPPVRKPQLPTPAPEAGEEGGKEKEKPVGRAGPSSVGEGGWYAVDVEYAGAEVRKWAGVTYEAEGGHEVGNMVRGLWDERGWETIWFVNPARLQSVPGYAHFHIFARRKTPTEIDISEKVYEERVKAANGVKV